jgi:CoA:oxalate CoA-transferase
MRTILEGIKVLEFTHVISGSYSGMLLGDMGADVIKIERPGKGEFYREEALKNEAGVSLIYPSYNRNKRSVTLNLKDPRAKEIVYDLIKDIDVVIENYRPGLLSEIGFGYEDLCKIKPDLIMVSISGFGKNGPYAAKPAYDMTISAISGFMSVNGAEGTPTKSGPAVCDFLSGIYGAMTVLAALRHRDQSLEGQFIDISMMECSMSILDAFFAQSQLTGVEPKGMGNRRANYTPVNSFRTLNGHIYIACSLEKHWLSLVQVMGQPELAKVRRFLTTKDRKAHEDIIEEIVEHWTQKHTSAELQQLLEDNGIPCAPINSINQVKEDPQVQARQSIIEFDYPGIGSYPVVAFVPKFSTIEVPVRRAPLLGEHNKEIFCDVLGYSEEVYQELIDKKTI